MTIGEWDKSARYDPATHRYIRRYHDVPWRHEPVRSPTSEHRGRHKVLDAEGWLVAIVGTAKLAERICRAINYFEDVA